MMHELSWFTIVPTVGVPTAILFFVLSRIEKEINRLSRRIDRLITLAETIREKELYDKNNNS